MSILKRLEQLTTEVSNEIDISSTLREGFDKMLSARVAEALKDIKNHGELVVKFKGRDKIDRYFPEEEDRQGLFYLCYKESKEETNRGYIELGGGTECQSLAYGNLIGRTLVFGSIGNSDKQTTNYLEGKIIPVIKDFFKYFGFKIKVNTEWGIVHDDVGV